MSIGLDRGILEMRIADTAVGIAVAAVRDVLGPREITVVPKAHPSIAGLMNLRGRVVTVLDVRSRLGLPPRADRSLPAVVVVEFDGELYGLNPDAVGDVVAVTGALESLPPTMDPRFRRLALGLLRRVEDNIVVLDTDSVFEIHAVAFA